MSPILREILLTLVLALALYGVFNLILETRGIEQTSMQPTIEPGERFFVSKMSYRLHDPERGDVIILCSPHDRDPIPKIKRIIAVLSGEPYGPDPTPNIKRIIGLPGETIEIKDGAVYINGLVLQEPYLVEKTTGSVSALTIPEDSYFVMGDHRSVSLDSRSWGILPRENIIGKTIWRYWPLGRFGTAPNSEPILTTTEGEGV